jgi:hypothetical protein
MSGFLRELHVPALIAAILVIVWSTAQLGQDEGPIYFPAEDPTLRRQVIQPHAQHPSPAAVAVIEP